LGARQACFRRPARRRSCSHRLPSTSGPRPPPSRLFSTRTATPWPRRRRRISRRRRRRSSSSSSSSSSTHLLRPRAGTAAPRRPTHCRHFRAPTWARAPHPRRQSSRCWGSSSNSRGSRRRRLRLRPRFRPRTGCSSRRRHSACRPLRGRADSSRQQRAQASSRISSSTTTSAPTAVPPRWMHLPARRHTPRWRSAGMAHRLPLPLSTARQAQPTTGRPRCTHTAPRRAAVATSRLTTTVSQLPTSSVTRRPRAPGGSGPIMRAAAAAAARRRRRGALTRRPPTLQSRTRGPRRRPLPTPVTLSRRTWRSSSSTSSRRIATARRACTVRSSATPRRRVAASLARIRSAASRRLRPRSHASASDGQTRLRRHARLNTTAATSARRRRPSGSIWSGRS
jgi:hypothetical protein